MITETIIKKDKQFFIQKTEETETSLIGLENLLQSVKAQKKQDVDNLINSFDIRIAELEDKIAQIKALSQYV